MNEIEIINLFFKYIEFPFQIKEYFKETGQRVVYTGSSPSSPDESFIIKVGQKMSSSDIARCEREIKILNNLNSKFFPKIQKTVIISKDHIDGFSDAYPNIKKNNLRIFEQLFSGPFVVTAEKFIKNIHWDKVFNRSNIDYAFYIKFFEKIFDALNIVWRSEIVHRDLKPDNILISESFEPIIIDFGAAKSLRAGTMQLTGSSGTPLTQYYASPEQFEVFQHNEVSHKSDQFSVGIIMFNTLTGQHPYLSSKDTLGTYKDKLKKGSLNTTLLEEINCPKPLQEFIHKLLGNRPYKRFTNFESIKNTINIIKGEIQ